MNAQSSNVCRNEIPDDHPFVVAYTEHFEALPTTISTDFAHAFKYYSSRPHEAFARRLLVRSVIGYIEGHMGAIREQLLFHHDYFTDNERASQLPEIDAIAKALNLDFPVTDYCALAGISLRSIKRADSEIREEFLCVEKTITLLFRLHGRLFDHSITPTNDSEGWQTLMEVKGKRNQLTHPRSAKDLEVTTEQVCQALAIFLWFKDHLDQIREIENAKWGKILGEHFPQLIRPT